MTIWEMGMIVNCIQWRTKMEYDPEAKNYSVKEGDNSRFLAMQNARFLAFQSHNVIRGTQGDR
jgi:hypothetical protein